MVNRANLTPAETALVQIYDRRADAYKVAEQQRLDELKLVNEQIASMINPGAAAATVAASEEKADGVPAEAMAVEEIEGAMDEMAADGEGGSGEDADARDDEAAKAAALEDPDRYKDLSKMAASASSRNQEKLAAKSIAKRKYDITAGPEQASSTSQKADGSEHRVKKMKKRTVVDEEDDIVDTEKVSSMLDPNGYISTETWNPSDKEVTTNASFDLNRFGVNEEDEEGADEDGADEDYLLKYAQTIVVQLQVPKAARRWSLNICPKDHKNLSDVFLHVNPRYNKGKLHLNDKQGTWGRPQEEAMKHASAGNRHRGDGLLSKDLELVITITRKAFCIYANGICAGIFPHRRDLRKHSELSLVLGRADDNGVTEDAVFNKVWWGYLNPRVNYNKLMDKVQKEFLTTLLTFGERQREKEAAAKAAAEGAASAGGVVQEEPSLRTLEVSGLPPHSDPKEMQQVEGVLYDLFAEFEPEDVQIAAGVGNGYVRLPLLESTLDALQEMQGVVIEAEGQKYALQLRRLDWT